MTCHSSRSTQHWASIIRCSRVFLFCFLFSHRRRGGKTLSGNGLAWSSASPRGAVENRIKRRKLIIKSSVVPQRPSRLRDRWWWDQTFFFHFPVNSETTHSSNMPQKKKQVPTRLQHVLTAVIKVTTRYRLTSTDDQTLKSSDCDHSWAAELDSPATSSSWERK